MLTHDECDALNISERLDGLEARIDAATYRVKVGIKIQLLEVDILLAGIEATDRKYSRTPKQEES